MADRKVPRTASEFLDSLTELFMDLSELATEEIEEDLRMEGIDTDEVVHQVKNLVRAKLDESRLAWQERARKERLAVLQRIEEMRTSSPGGVKEDSWEKLKRVLLGQSGQRAQEHALAYFRKLEEDKVTEDDVKSLLDDLERLNFLTCISGADEGQSE